MGDNCQDGSLIYSNLVNNDLFFGLFVFFFFFCTCFDFLCDDKFILEVSFGIH